MSGEKGQTVKEAKGTKHIQTIVFLQAD